MRKPIVAALCLICFGAGLIAQNGGRGPVPGDHTKVPPYHAPAEYLSAAEIQSALNAIDPKVLNSLAGGSIPIAKGIEGVVRRRVDQQQYAIIHTHNLEYMIMLKGTGTLVTGGTLIPPTIDSDIYPKPGPDAIVRSVKGIDGGLERNVGPGDVIVNPPGTPHWWKHIDSAVEYVEIHVYPMNPDPTSGEVPSFPYKYK